MDVVDPLLLKPVFDAVIAALTGEAIGRFKSRFGSKDDMERAFQVALGRAISQYATTNSGLAVSKVLTEKDSFLSRANVGNELAKILQPQPDPDFALIGSEWRAALGDDAPDWDYTKEARVLVGYLRGQLTRVDQARGILLVNILDDVSHELARIHATVANALKPGSSLRTHLVDQTAYAYAKTRDFVGREFIFSQVDDFLNSHNSGYYLIAAKPGFGKSSLLAQLAITRQYISHYNIATSDIVSSKSFFGNVCAQLIARFNLPAREWPDRATDNPTFMEELLAEVAAERPNQRVVIAVDALDEAQKPAPRVNHLYLPHSLPDGCYFIITTRDDGDKKPPPLHAEPKDYIFIEQTDEHNLADVRRYIQSREGRPGVRDYMQLHGLDIRRLVEHVADKSQGNFMYIHHVMGDIEAGVLRDRELKDLPLGLEEYYQDHLKKMRNSDADDWFRYKVPVIGALLAYRGLSLRQVTEASGIGDPARVRDVLSQWGQFLDEDVKDNGGRVQRVYRVYHKSFCDFLDREFHEIVDFSRRLEETAKDDVLREYVR